jgi:hypothetical protein
MSFSEFLWWGERFIIINAAEAGVARLTILLLGSNFSHCRNIYKIKSHPLLGEGDVLTVGRLWKV